MCCHVSTQSASDALVGTYGSAGGEKVGKKGKKEKENKVIYFLCTLSILLKAKRNLLYIRNQSVPRSKHFPSRL